VLKPKLDTIKPRRYTSEDEAFFRRLVIPEEDRHLFTSAPWDGSFRWFRSPNVVCLEQWPRAVKREPGLVLRRG
jgi:hypothetical protein